MLRAAGWRTYIGEPLDNMDNVLRFLELVNSPHGLNIGMRHISLSTCGVVPGIDALAEKQLQLTLSVSLHAPDSETRTGISGKPDGASALSTP